MTPDTGIRTSRAIVPTRLATVRLLELHTQHEALLRYAVREDAPLRTAVSLLTASQPVLAARRGLGAVDARSH